MRKSILIVEDEAISAMALEFALQRLGYNVSGIVDTGEDAIEHVANRKPDLVLMDTQLNSSMTGVEAANQIWRDAKVRSVFVSAYTAVTIQDDFVSSYPFVNLVKPILEEDLKRVFEQVFNEN